MIIRIRWNFSIVFLAAAVLAGSYQLASTSSLAIRQVPTAEKLVALTYDDGPQPQTTPQLLRILQQKQVKATFFVLGVNAAAQPEMVRQAYRDGHEIASHAYTHRFFNTLSTAEYTAEMDQANQLISRLASQPALFRPPGGAWNDTVARVALEKGQTTILWSVDSGDWRRPPVSRVVATVLSSVKPGAIVLMHDGQPDLPTPEATAIVIDKLRESGYRFVTVSELLQHSQSKPPSQP